jgi:uncharacterized protein
MLRQHPWITGVAASTSLLGLAVAGGLVVLANRLVKEFSHPHEVIDSEQFTLSLPHAVPEPPRAYQRSLSFRTSDGTLLSGDFWAQPQPAQTVIISHGYRAARSFLRPVAAIEYAMGYNVLLFDFRGHGESEGVFTSGGKVEVLDLEAAILAANVQPETLPHSILIHGFSMGAAVALLLPPRPEVAAIVADSPYARSDDILRRLIRYRLIEQSGLWKPLNYLRSLFPFVAWATVAIGVLVFRFRFGKGFVARPDASFKHWAWQAKHAKKQPSPRSTPILLIHAIGDPLIPFAHARQLVARARERRILIETYFVDHPAHCGAYLSDPDRYVSTIKEFLARHLGSDDTSVRA